jgi:hypothetical protein
MLDFEQKYQLSFFFVFLTNNFVRKVFVFFSLLLLNPHLLVKNLKFSLKTCIDFVFVDYFLLLLFMKILLNVNHKIYIVSQVVVN